jgi:uncharacterized membrane protein YsdA (DUF1294 family)
MMDVPLPLVPVTIYTGLNILAFAVFTLDKLNAKVRMGRCPEYVLLLLSVLGPFGALTAMIGFRHKTRHVKFFLVPAFALLHLLLFVWLWPQIIE